MNNTSIVLTKVIQVELCNTITTDAVPSIIIVTIVGVEAKIWVGWMSIYS